MTIEISKATEVQNARAVEINLQLAGLARKRDTIQAAKEADDKDFVRRIAEIHAEEHKLNDELAVMGESVITEK